MILLSKQTVDLDLEFLQFIMANGQFGQIGSFIFSSQVPDLFWISTWNTCGQADQLC